MPRENDNPHVEPAPHFDGKKESIINDPTATASSKMGVQIDTKEEFAQEREPFNSIFKQDKKLKEFEKLMGGKKVEE